MKKSEKLETINSKQSIGMKREDYSKLDICRGPKPVPCRLPGCSFSVCELL